MSRLVCLIVIIGLISVFALAGSANAQEGDVVPQPGKWIGKVTFVSREDYPYVPWQAKEAEFEINFTVTENSEGIIGTSSIIRANDNVSYASSWAAPIENGVFSVHIDWTTIGTNYNTSYHWSWAGAFMSSTEAQGVLTFVIDTDIVASNVEWSAEYKTE